MKVHIYKNAEGSDSAAPIISLHGFPSLGSKQNRDLAQALANSTKRPVHVLLYSGLTQAPGQFSFRDCLRDVHAYVGELIATAEDSVNFYLDVLGHSWGGFVGLTLTQKFPKFIRRLALMSPLLEFASIEHVEVWMKNLSEMNPALQLGNIKERAHEFVMMDQLYSIDTLISSIPIETPVMFLQARLDDTTPTPVALRKLAKFTKQPEFALVETDHGFTTDRPALVTTLQNFLSM